MAEDDAESSKKDGETVGANSSYYIHAADYPKQMQVNDALTDSNYNDWVQEMRNFLFAKNKIGFLDGTIPKPIDASANYMPWIRCDAMVKGMVDYRNGEGHQINANTAAEIWVDLEAQFGKESTPRAYKLKQTLNNTSQDGASVSAYYTRMRSLWDKIQTISPIPRCTCGKCTCDLGKRLSESKEKERIYDLLMGLDNVFSTIKTQILASKPTPTLGTT
ncbi:hypothetical protein Lser_V15G35016 [Lactuca serriola]